jgi:RimJ/RimL family protein N-acetyltransferase
MTRFDLQGHRTAGDPTLRTLTERDAVALAGLARRVEHVRGSVPLTTTESDAMTLIQTFNRHEATDEGVLVGVFAGHEPTLVGIISVELTDVSEAMLGLWNDPSHDSRHVTGDALAAITKVAHTHWGIVRLWADVDKLDPLARYLSVTASWREEAVLPSEDGTERRRYSSIG